MKILLVCATDFEIAPFTQGLVATETVNKHLSKYQLNAHQIDILVTGVGMVFTTFHLSTLLAKEKYDLAINAGVAGAIDKSIATGEIVHVVDDYFYELGAEDGDDWLSVSQLGLLKEIDKPYTDTGLHNHNLPDFNLIKNLRQVKGQTVNKVHGNLQSIKTMQTRSQAQIESMEGAAFIYCCLHYHLPCAQIRAISNVVEVRNKANWQLSAAVTNLNNFLKRLFID